MKKGRQSMDSKKLVTIKRGAICKKGRKDVSKGQSLARKRGSKLDRTKTRFGERMGEKGVLGRGPKGNQAQKKREIVGKDAPRWNRENHSGIKKTKGKKAQQKKKGPKRKGAWEGLRLWREEGGRVALRQKRKSWRGKPPKKKWPH